VKVNPRPKRKRKIAGPKIAPLIAMPMVPPLSDTEWEPFLRLLPYRPKPELLRSKLDQMMVTYLGILEAEASSPSAREVAAVLEGLARRAHQFAKDLFTLDIHLSHEEEGRFNTTNEAAADVLAAISLVPERRPVLDAAIRANEVLAAVAAQEAGKLAERSKKGKPTRGGPTAWMLSRFAELLRDKEPLTSLPPGWGDPFCVLSQHFLRVTLTRAKTLRKPEGACKEIKSVLMLSRQVFLGRLRDAAQAGRESSSPI
jgi:hypothetical protein